MDANAESQRHEVARAVLSALIATLPSEEYAHGFVLLPQVAPISMPVLIARLAQQAKPITCIALPYGLAVAIGWWPMESDDAADHRDLMSGMFADVTSTDSKERAHDREASFEAREAIALSSASLKAFLYDYHLPFAEYQIRRLGEQPRIPESGFALRVAPCSFGNIKGDPLG